MIAHTENKNIYIDKYVSIMVVYQPIIDSGLSKSINKHLISPLSKDNNALIYK